MSGGTFGYDEYHLLPIINDLRDHIDNKKIELREQSPNHYSQETIDVFEKALKRLMEDYIYIKRIDYLLDGDDGEGDFHERLRKDLEDLENNCSEYFYNC